MDDAIEDVVGSCMHIAQQLESGHVETVYQNALAIDLASKGWTTQCERPVPITFTDTKGHVHVVGTGRIDIYATSPQHNLSLIIEVKVSTSSVSKASHRRQVEAYAKHVSGTPVLVTFTSANCNSPIVEAKLKVDDPWLTAMQS